jgi:threonine synthase
MSDVEYDLSAVEVGRSDNPYRRFRDLLPVADATVLPSETVRTPTIHATRLGEALGLPWLYLKDETGLPTGTTKDRMAAVSLAFMHERGVREFCVSSTGNSSTAYAQAITRFPELVMYLFTAAQFQDRVQLPESDQVVNVVLRGASFVEAAQEAHRFAARHGLVPERGFFNPGRREGLKLAFLEATDQVPKPIDWYVQAVSSAMGVYGAFKGAKELRALGLIDRLPRLLCVQQESCAPMVSAWRDGSMSIRPEHVVRQPRGIASAILRGDPSRAYPRVREIVAESGGSFVAVSETEIRAAHRLVEDLEGISTCFSAAAAVAGLSRLRRSGALPAHQTVLVNLTGKERSPQIPASALWLTRQNGGWVVEDPNAALPALATG